jgi:hypothetical protein
VLLGFAGSGSCSFAGVALLIFINTWLISWYRTNIFSNISTLNQPQLDELFYPMVTVFWFFRAITVLGWAMVSTNSSTSEVRLGVLFRLLWCHKQNQVPDDEKKAPSHWSRKVAPVVLPWVLLYEVRGGWPAQLPD